jgi:DNA repair ATPase RecN
MREGRTHVTIKSFFMKRILISLLGLLFIFFAACKNAGKKSDSMSSSGTQKAKADSLYNQLLNEHEEGMKGWMKIEGRQKQIKTLLDSLAKLPSKVQPSLDALKAKLNEATAALDDAYKQMDDWMTGMNLDSAINNLELRIQYLADEKGKGSTIKELINNSLQKADSVLKVKL